MITKIHIRIKTFFSRHLTPSRIFVISFAAVIMAGAILLWFPFSASKGQLTFVDALFTSTSAVCVTGLVVLDVGKDLSLTGQIQMVPRANFVIKDGEALVVIGKASDVEKIR